MCIYADVIGFKIFFNNIIKEKVKSKQHIHSLVFSENWVFTLNLTLDGEESDKA